MTSSWTAAWSTSARDFKAKSQMARRSLLEDLANGTATTRRVIRDIVETCRESAHWKDVGGSEIPASEAVLKALFPIRYYEDFLALLADEQNAKGGILTSSPVLRWLKTSGTTGRSKAIPYTLHWLVNYRLPAMYAMWGTFLEHCPDILEHPFAVLDTQTVREDVSEYISGVSYQAISNRQPRLISSDWSPPWYNAPWFVPESAASHPERMYVRARSLINHRLRFISAINPSTLISFRDSICEFREQLVREVHEGTLKGINYECRNEVRARELEVILGNDQFSLVDIWPSLRGYSCWTSASARLYNSKLQSILPALRPLPFMSCGTEGVTTIPIDTNPHSQPLALNQGWYEFIPAHVDLDDVVNRKGFDETIGYGALREGEQYHLIMSQANGMMRLATGDIYTVNEIRDGVPWISFVRRAGVFHSFTGEKLTEAQVSDAISIALERLGLNVGLYMCGPKWAEPPFYIIAIELESTGSHVSADLGLAIDRALQEVSVEYSSKRVSGRLGQIEIIVVPHHQITIYIEKQRTNKNSNQYKYKPFNNDIEFLDHLLAM